MTAYTEEMWENQSLYKQVVKVHRYLTSDRLQATVPDARVALLGRTLAKMQLLSVTSDANLGFATTSELLTELQARAKLNGYAGYRTVEAEAAS